MLCDRWRGCEKYREYIEPWVKYRKSNRKFKICIVPSLVVNDRLALKSNHIYMYCTVYQIMGAMMCTGRMFTVTFMGTNMSCTSKPLSAMTKSPWSTICVRLLLSTIQGCHSWKLSKLPDFSLTQFDYCEKQLVSDIQSWCSIQILQFVGCWS